MMADWKTSVSAIVPTVTINDIADYVKDEHLPGSPIDSFYRGRDALLNGINPTYAEQHESIPPLILVGIISLTENFFREIMAEIISVCPKAKEKSAGKTLNLATIWFGYGKLEKGAFENISFADIENIKKNLKQLLGFSIDSSSQVSAPLGEFAKLCELRHAIVHSGSLLAGKNAIKLSLPSSRYPAKIKFGYPEIQEAAEVCTALVCTINIELFKHISQRWLKEWPHTAAYANEDFHKLFKKVWAIFYSDLDSTRNLISSPLTMMKAKNDIIRTGAT